jgi:alginate O-acetyltransferase complex protein AlgI
MVFSEYTFLFLFLPLALGLHFATPVGWRHVPLSLVSYAFYGWVRYDFCLIMLASTLLDYFVGRRLGVTSAVGRRKLLVTLSIAGNLGLLAYFKYRNFGVENWNAIAESLSWPALSATALVLPVGISFYTFQSMSYTLDVYRGAITVERNFPRSSP